jgi:hypothetical protein
VTGAFGSKLIEVRPFVESRCIVTGTPDPNHVAGSGLLQQERDEQGREVYHDVDVVVTGVPAGAEIAPTFRCKFTRRANRTRKNRAGPKGLRFACPRAIRAALLFRPRSRSQSQASVGTSACRSSSQWRTTPAALSRKATSGTPTPRFVSMTCGAIAWRR